MAWGVAADRIFSETFGSGPSVTPGIISGVPDAPPHPPIGPAGKGPTFPLREAALWPRGLQRTKACSNLPKHVTSRCDGLAEPESVTHVRVV